MEASGMVTSEVTLSAGGIPLRMKITVPARRVKPQVMLPIFQKMANVLTDLGIAAIEKEGKKISCQKGCGACCRQPIPLGEVELYYIALIVENIPEPRRTEIRRRFTTAATRFRTRGWLESFEQCTDETELKSLIRAYFFEGIACPFLEDESCSIYPHRPVACREFLVTSSPANCASLTEAAVEQVQLPLKASDGLGRLAKGGQLKGKAFLPMVFALDWVKAHPEGFEEKTGQEWLAEFFG